MLKKLLSLGLLFALPQATCVAMQPRTSADREAFIACYAESRQETLAVLEKKREEKKNKKQACEVAALVEKHKEAILADYDFCTRSNNFTPKMIPELPGFFIKWCNGASRVKNAAYMHEVIQENKLTLLKVPRKYLFQIDGKDVVLAQAISVGDNARYFGGELLTQEEVKQIVVLLKNIGYGDFNGLNLVRDIQDRKIVFIDTEDKSFLHKGSLFLSKHERTSDSKFYLAVDGLKSVEMFFKVHERRMTSEAKNWLQAETGL